MLELTLILHGMLLQADDETDAESRPAWVKVAIEHMRDYRVFPTGDPEQEYDAPGEPVFHHVQNVRGSARGSVFLWSDDSGRPVAVGDVFFLPSRAGQHAMYSEWHSLASGPITVTWDGKTLLRASEEPLDWKPIPDGGTPSTDKVRREFQLRQLSRRFTAHLVTKFGADYGLRLLAQPIYKFDASGDDGILSGGLFAFCQETDPEIFLLIEAQKTQSGWGWFYSVAEFSNLSLFVQLDGQPVWSADPPFRSGNHVGGIRTYVTLPEEKR